MNAISRLPLSAFCVTLLVTISVSVLAKPADMAVWTPNPSLLSKLNPDVHFGTFLFRPPPGYIWGVRIDGMVDSDYVDFKRPARLDKSSSSLEITYHDQDISKAKTHKALSELQKIQFSNANDVVLAPPKQGRINGLSAIREEYRCKRSSSLVVTNGCYYIISNPSGFIIADADDDAPSNESNLSLLETSVLTFQAANPSATPTVP